MTKETETGVKAALDIETNNRKMYEEIGKYIESRLQQKHGYMLVLTSGVIDDSLVMPIWYRGNMDGKATADMLHSVIKSVMDSATNKTVQ